MAAVATKNTNLFIVISVVKKDKRERLFKHIDDPKNAKGLVDYSPSKRVITLDLFSKLQSRIDAYPHARVSLVTRLGDGTYDGVDYAVDAKPMSESYNGILRRIRS